MTIIGTPGPITYDGQSAVNRSIVHNHEPQTMRSSIISEGLSYNISANTLRSPNLKISFGRGSKRPEPVTRARRTQDLFYDLPSTLK